MPPPRKSRALGRSLPRIVEPPPGPRSRRLSRDLERYESPGVSSLGAGHVPIVWKRARGANVEDVDGNVYIDLTAGFGVAGGGHGAGSVVRAIRRQSGALVHGLGDVHPNAPRLALARRLAELAPGADNKVIFCGSGAEAVELAMKTATLYTGKHGFLAFEGGFHGQTYGALAVTSRERFREPFAPQLNQHVARVPYAYCYRCPLGLEYPGCDVACLEPVEQALASPPESVGPIAAVVVEPVQGREGTVAPPAEYLPRLKEMCERAGVLLIVDELLTGFGRTGRWFYVGHREVTPDILCVGKAMGGGLPIAACVARAEVMDAWRHQDHEAPHSSTFMGNPLASAAALAAIDEIDERNLPARARVLGDALLKRCHELRGRRRLIGDVRGMGMMVGIELVRDRESREPAGDEAGEVVRHCLEAGVILLAGGPSGNVLSLTPPLTITHRQLGHALAVLDASLAAVEEGMGEAVTASDPLHSMSLGDVARLLRRRQFSCVEVHDAAFRRIDEVEPQLEAFITLLREESLGEAVEADRALARGESTGPLHGIPVSLKDLYDTAGIRTTAGSRVMAERVPASDATVTARLKSAGAIIIGKANQTEFAYGGTYSAFGALKNPWSLEHFPGSSSSGSGASVAAGMGYASMGTDTGGSVRIPAAMCGVVGLKPTYGRGSRHGIVPLSLTLDHAGPLTRTVADSALVLQAIAGYDPRDPTSSRRPVPSYLRALPSDLGGVTLGVPSAYFYEDLDPDVAARLEEAHGVLRKLGARLKRVNIPHAAHSMAALVTIIESEAAAVHWPTLIERPGDYDEVFRARAMRGLLTPAVTYLDAQRLRGLLIDEFATALRGVDALVTPTCPEPPYRMDQIPAPSAMVSTIGRFTNLANMTGLPALSVPCGFSRDGLPVGMQLMGRAFDERTLIAIGNAYQSATDWRLRRPPL